MNETGNNPSICAEAVPGDRLDRMQSDMRAVLNRLRGEGRLTYEIERAADAAAKYAGAIIENPNRTDDFKAEAVKAVETFTAMCRGN